MRRPARVPSSPRPPSPDFAGEGGEIGRRHDGAAAPARRSTPVEGLRRWWLIASLACFVSVSVVAGFVAGSQRSAAATEPAVRARVGLVANDGQPEPAPVPTSRHSPLRVWSDGDSTSYFMTVAFFDLMTQRGAAPVRGADYKISSGLVNKGSSAVLGVPFSDWFSYASEEMERYAPDIVVFMVGANDLSYAAANPEDYRSRIGWMMDLLRAPGRVVLWVGQPAITRSDIALLVPGINALFRAEAAGRPWVTFVDASSIVPDAEDGVHLSPSAGRRLAGLVAAVLDAR